MMDITPKRRTGRLVQVFPRIKTTGESMAPKPAAMDKRLNPLLLSEVGISSTAHVTMTEYDIVMKNFPIIATTARGIPSAVKNAVKDVLINLRKHIEVDGMMLISNSCSLFFNFRRMSEIFINDKSGKDVCEWGRGRGQIFQSVDGVALSFHTISKICLSI